VQKYYINISTSLLLGDKLSGGINMLNTTFTNGAHIITVGNEKGGSGKSTIAMHLAIGLLRLGYKVGTVDLDSHQATLTSYMKNRWNYIAGGYADVPSPEHILIDRAGGNNVAENYEQERWRVETAVSELSANNDFVIIDTPGTDRFMNVVGHSLADTLITPMNDSFVDLDVIAKINPHDGSTESPSIYTKMVDDLRRRREVMGKADLNWFVMINRATNSKYAKSNVKDVVTRLQHELNFVEAPSLSDRNVYKELFLQGLTLLDIKESNTDNVLNMANINSRQEVRNLVRMILPNKEVSTLSLLKTV